MLPYRYNITGLKSYHADLMKFLFRKLKSLPVSWILQSLSFLDWCSLGLPLTWPSLGQSHRLGYEAHSPDWGIVPQARYMHKQNNIYSYMCTCVHWIQDSTHLSCIDGACGTAESAQTFNGMLTMKLVTSQWTLWTHSSYRNKQYTYDSTSEHYMSVVVIKLCMLV